MRFLVQIFSICLVEQLAGIHTRGKQTMQHKTRSGQSVISRSLWREHLRQIRAFVELWLCEHDENRVPLRLERVGESRQNKLSRREDTATPLPMRYGRFLIFDPEVRAPPNLLRRNPVLRRAPTYCKTTGLLTSVGPQIYCLRPDRGHYGAANHLKRTVTYFGSLP